MMWNAVVLAGDADRTNPVARAGLTSHKAAAPVGDMKLVDFPLAALGAVMDEGRIGRIIVASAPGAPPIAAGPWDEIEAGETLSDSLKRAFDAIGAPLLITTCDAGLLAPEILIEFMDAAESGAAYSAAISPLERTERAPDAPPRQGFALAEGRFVGANLFAIAATDPSQAFAALAKVERRRRSGDFLLTALAWTLRPPSIKGVEDKASRLLGDDAKLITLNQPEAGFDVNTALDLIHVRRRWADWLAGKDVAQTADV